MGLFLILLSDFFLQVRKNCFEIGRLNQTGIAAKDERTNSIYDRKWPQSRLNKPVLNGKA